MYVPENNEKGTKTTILENRREKAQQQQQEEEEDAQVKVVGKRQRATEEKHKFWGSSSCEKQKFLYVYALAHIIFGLLRKPVLLYFRGVRCFLGLMKV